MIRPPTISEEPDIHFVHHCSKACPGQNKLAIICGKLMMENAKMRGMTPLPAILMGMTDD